jgi:hypothetical protein
MFGCIPNLVASEVFRALPWEWNPEQPLPEDLAVKAHRSNWAEQPTTKHCFYSGFVGKIAALRVNEANPAQQMVGLVADIDVALDQEVLLQGVKRIPEGFRPMWFAKTLSNHWHLVLPFSRPFVPGACSKEFWNFFLKSLVKKLTWDNLIGLDKAIFRNAQYYFNYSPSWFEIEGTCPLDTSIASSLLVDALAHSLSITKEAAGLSDKEAAFAALAKKYPRFAIEWDGLSLQPGTMGTTFWDPESQSPKSAKVLREGILSFAEHNGGKAFWSWADLLGADFVDRDQGTRDQDIMENVFYAEDENRYYVWSEKGMEEGDPWMRKVPADMKNWLRSKGFSGKVPKGEELSEIDLLLQVIQEHNKVQGTGPYMFGPRVVKTPQGRQLNNYIGGKLVKPAVGPQVWGPDGGAPTICAIMSHMWKDKDNLDMAMAFWKVAYEGQLYQRKELKQALCIVGSPHTGKTMFAQGLLAKSVGGAYPATAWLTGQKNFTGSQWYCPALTVDDGEMSATKVSHIHFSERLKAIASCGTVEHEQKFRGAMDVSWFGHVTIVTNRDSSVISRSLPALSISNDDKVIIVETSEESIEFRQTELEEIFEKEMPAFLRLLLDWKIPKHLETKGRYRLRAWKSPAIEKHVKRLEENHLFQTSVHRWLRGKLDGTQIRQFKFAVIDVFEAMKAGFVEGTKYDAKRVAGYVHDMYQRLRAMGETWLEYNAETDEFTVYASRIPERL